MAPRRRKVDQGFTLLEVLIAVAILSLSLTSLLTSQMSAMRATRYAKQVSVAAFLAEYQLVEIEWIVKQEDKGWGNADKEFSGDFSEQGWPDMRYECLVDMVELPDHNALMAAKDAGDTDDNDDLGGVQSGGASAFSAMGMVWPIVKGAVEQAIRKVSCTVKWKDGKIEHDFKLETYWTDTSKLAQLPQAGGEVTRDDDTRDDGEGAASGQGGGTPPTGQSAGNATARPGGIR